MRCAACRREQTGRTGVIRHAVAQEDLVFCKPNYWRRAMRMAGHPSGARCKQNRSAHGNRGSNKPAHELPKATHRAKRVRGGQGLPVRKLQRAENKPLRRQRQALIISERDRVAARVRHWRSSTTTLRSHRRALPTARAVLRSYSHAAPVLIVVTGCRWDKGSVGKSPAQFQELL